MRAAARTGVKNWPNRSCADMSRLDRAATRVRSAWTRRSVVTGVNIAAPTDNRRGNPPFAAERGESLKDLVNRAVARELDLPSTPRGKAGRVRLPLIARDVEPTVLVTNEDIEVAFDAEDIERYTG